MTLLRWTVGLAVAVVVGLVAGFGLPTLGRGPGTAAGPVEIVEAWTAPTPPVGNVAAFHLTVANRSDRPQRLVAASSARCDRIQLHRTVISDDGVASMSLVGHDGLVVAAGERLSMGPSGLHLMCLGLDRPIEDGDLITVTVLMGDGDPIEAVVLVDPDRR